MADIQAEQTSQIITATFAGLGVNPPFIETILLKDRFYVGRKFRAGGFQVIWWAEKNLIEVFDEDGQALKTIAREQEIGMAG